MARILFAVFALCIAFPSALLYRLDLENVLEKSGNIPFDTRVLMDKLRYVLFDDPKYPNAQKTLDSNNPEIESYNGGKVYILVHGYKDYQATGWMNKVTEDLLESSEPQHNNVIQMFWEAYSSSEYPESAKKTFRIGFDLALFIAKLKRNSNVDLDDVVLIGFDMGAHIAGTAGKFARLMTNEKVRKIIALDPPSQLFDARSANRLNKNDAEVVAVMHTSKGEYGISESLGDIDIFPNGGEDQPGCDDDDTDCDHEYSLALFLQGMNDWNLQAEKCDNYEQYKTQSCKYGQKISVTALDATSNDSGNYYIDTDISGTQNRQLSRYRNRY